MKRIKQEPEKRISKKLKQKTEPKKAKLNLQKIPAENYPDVQRLVHLLQVHQIELEHQNEELRLAQEELEVSRNKYVNLFDFSPTPYFTLDKQGTIKEVNLSASKMFLIDRNKLIGKRFNTFIPLNERDLFISFINSVFDSAEKQSCELSMINKDKRLFHVLLEGLVLDDALETEKKCQLALIDLTEYKRVQNSLKKSNEELKELNATKDKFFSIIAHDLRSPFQSLLSYSEILATDIENLSSDDIVSFSKELNDSLNNLYSLLENLLHWSMMQRDLLEYNPLNFNLYDKINKIISIVEHSASKKNISISNRVDTELSVFADANMLRSIIQNLLINAIKFTNDKGRIIISSQKKGEVIELSVEDTGIGIDKENISKLFEFNTIYTTKGTAGEKGTGLGLPLCREFVERNYGNIWVESELGKGSKFTFTISKAIT
jgi:PAS domain S-box-containing protein